MRFKVVVAYDCSDYHGWQTQRKNNSIQEVIEAVLKQMHKHDVEIVASGRTDSKVHALGQVFHFDTDLCISKERIQAALNAQLPKTIRIKQVEEVSDDFHARFDAIGKRYEYYLSSDINNPFIQKYMGIDYHTLDLSMMKEAAKYFLGTHDFTSFTSAKIDPRKTKIKTVTKFEIIKEGNVHHFIIEGDGFLRYMVRMMVQTIVMVGKKRIKVEDVKAMLDGKDKHLCQYKADPNGLYLVEVKY